MDLRIEIYLALALGILGIIMYLVNKTPLTIIILLVIAFCLSFYIIWTFPWIRDSIARRLGGLLFVAACLCLLGDYVWPPVAKVNQTKHQELVAKQPTADEIAKEVIKRLPPGLVPPQETKFQQTESPTFKEKIENIEVSFGGGFINHISLQRLQSGAVEPIDLGGYKPIRIYLDQGRLFVDASIYGGSDKPPIEVKHNDFIVRVPGCDRNFDLTALEVVNKTNSPIFQLIYRTPSRIIVNGIFPSPAGLWLANNDVVMASMPNIPKSFRILRLFKYPSNQFPGQREEARRIIPRPKLKEQAINLSKELINFAHEQEKIYLNAKQSGEVGKMTSKTASLYDENFALKCADIAEEIAASGINVGRLPSLCRNASSTMAIKEVANRLKTFANLLP